LQDAKARFSELVRRVRSEGPQHVTVHGRDAVVVISAEEFRRLRRPDRRGPHRRHAGRTGQRHRSDSGARADARARRNRVTGWLLDTNILSELRRPKPEPKVIAFVAARPLDRLFVSAATIAEIRFGIECVADPMRRAELDRWLARRIRPMFEQRILAITEDVMVRWRIMVEDGRKAGHTFSQPDLIIAATAFHHGLTVVTRDESDYHRAGVAVLNPWHDPLPNLIP
jgi:prevent-host-death family protein